MIDRFNRKVNIGDYIAFIRTYGIRTQLVPALVTDICTDGLHVTSLDWDKLGASESVLIAPLRTIRISKEMLSGYEYKILSGYDEQNNALVATP